MTLRPILQILFGISIFLGPLRAEEAALVVKNATLMSTDAVLIIEDAEGKKTEAKPPAGDYGKDPAVGKFKPGETAKVSGEGGADLIISGAVTARLEAGTEIRIPQAKKSDHSIELVKGRMFITVDAEKLKKRKKKEFRLKTPKAVLAVKGTRFVSDVSPDLETTVVVRGKVNLYDILSEKSGEIPLKKSLEVSVDGKLATRVLNTNEKEYEAFFNQYELVFRPLEFNFRRAESRSQFFPDRGTWQAKPELLEVREKTDERSESKILRLVYGNKDQLAAKNLQLFCALPFTQPELKEMVGLLLTYRSSADLNVFIEGDLIKSENGYYRIQEAVNLKKSEAEDTWEEVFIPAGFHERFIPDPDGAKKPELKIVPGHLSRWPAEKPVPFTLEVASLQTVSHGQDD